MPVVEHELDLVLVGPLRYSVHYDDARVVCLHETVDAVAQLIGRLEGVDVFESDWEGQHAEVHAYVFGYLGEPDALTERRAVLEGLVMSDPIGILNGINVELVAYDAVLEAALVVVFDVDDGLMIGGSSL